MGQRVNTRAICFPFDLFGSAGTAAGADLLEDALRELLADNQRERMPTRAAAYAGKVHVRHLEFETLQEHQSWRQRGRQAARRVLARSDFLLWATGNHLGVLPVYDELTRLPGRTLVVQFDAHLDIYNLTDCTAELSHGNWLLHLDGSLPEVVNVGHRELLLQPAHVGTIFRAAFSATDLALRPEGVLAQLAELARRVERVFIDLDCDVLDPAFFPGVLHPLPFGLAPPLLLRLLDAVWSERVIGLAISEYCPARDRHDQSLCLLLWFIEYLLLRLYESPTAPRRVGDLRNDLQSGEETAKNE